MDNNLSFNKLKKDLKLLHTKDATYIMSADEFIHIDDTIDDLEKRESYIDVLIDEIKQNNTIKSKRDDYFNRILSSNKDDFDTTILNLQQEDNTLLNNVLHDFVSKTSHHKK